MRAPLFWKEKTPISTALAPASRLFGLMARRRRSAGAATKLPVRVICIGNVVAGGAGKTPVALAIGALLKAEGRRPHFLSRGYKGTLKGPVQVDPAHHTAREVGDEPLLLAETLPTWVSKSKVAGAEAAVAAGAEMILMDDGFQNPSLHKDMSLLVIDGEYGFGNGLLMPAGPLREPVESAMARASAVLLMGQDKHGALRFVPASMPVLRAQMNPAPEAESLRGKPVVAFAGIARPHKFYHTLQDMGCAVRKMVAYPDHYVFKPKDIACLRARAKEFQAPLVTTLKDYVRLPDSMRAEVIPVRVEVVFEDSAALLRTILA